MPSEQQYINGPTLKRAIELLFGTADHYLKIWFVLKHMGMAPGGVPVQIDTQNSTESLKRLFGFGSPEGEFYVPFAHTKRFLKMAGDASRSVVQTNISNWTKQSIVTCDPTGFLHITTTDDGKYLVSPTRSYPEGLGFGSNGFALSDQQRVSVPLTAFAAWYGRQSPIPEGEDPAAFLDQQMKQELHITEPEAANIFIDSNPLLIETQASPLSDAEIYQLCSQYMQAPGAIPNVVLQETFEQHAARVRSMTTVDNRPTWLRRSPDDLLRELIDSGARVILLYGPPRTGKTRAIDNLFKRDRDDRATIQIHDGWTYEHLLQGQQPDNEGKFCWQSGALKKAIDDGKKIIVLEEINRTLISQSLGEAFSLIEEKYRGQNNAVTLRNGDRWWIPEDTLLLMTMNTVDKSTEEVDDALLGRIAAIEFPARVEDLTSMLSGIGIPEDQAQKYRELYAGILDVYPLGHGYFAQLRLNSDPITYYITRIRPVLFNHLRHVRPEDLAQIDNLVDSIFA